MTVYLDDDISSDYEKVSDIASKINYTILLDLVKNHEIIYDPITKNDGYTIIDNVKNPFYIDFKKANKDFAKMEWLFRIELNRNKMVYNNISIIDIKTKFVKFWKYTFNNIKGIKKKDKQIINSFLSCAILSNFDNSISPKIHIRFSLSEVNYELLLNIKNWFLNNIILKGIEGIEKIGGVSSERLITFDKKSKKFIETKKM